MQAYLKTVGTVQASYVIRKVRSPFTFSLALLAGADAHALSPFPRRRSSSTLNG